jgi:uncharacterized protein
MASLGVDSSSAAVAVDRRGAPIDLAPVWALIRRIVTDWKPDQIWLFGSRARGTAYDRSDWDLLVLVADDAPDAVFDPLASYRLRKSSGVVADIVPQHTREFREDRTVPNTLAFEVARDGVIVYER